LRTAEEIAQRFGGGTLFFFRHEELRGFWWDQGLVDRDTLALLELRTYARDVLLNRFRQTG
jgi:hypothetical protein